MRKRRTVGNRVVTRHPDREVLFSTGLDKQYTMAGFSLFEYELDDLTTLTKIRDMTIYRSGRNLHLIR